MANTVVQPNPIGSYQEGSLAGVPFHIKRHSYRGTHRVSDYLYPESDRVEYARQGRGKFDFSLAAYVVGSAPGDDTLYEEKRDKLIAVLRRGGTVTLIHPYLGTVRVEIRSFTQSESVEEQNLARFRITLSQADAIQKNQYVRWASSLDDVSLWATELMNVVMLDAAFQIDDWMLNARSPSLKQRLLSNKLVGMVVAGSKFVKEAFRTVTSAIEFTTNAVKKATSTIAKVRKVGRRIREVKKALSKLRNSLDVLVMTGATLVSKLRNVIRPGYNEFGEYPSVTAALSMFREYADLGGRNVAEEKDQMSNQVNRVVNIVSIATASEMAVTMPFSDRSTLEEAEQVLTNLYTTRLSVEGITTEERRSLMGLKTAVVNTLRARRGEFSNKVVVVSYTQPMISLVYNETGATRGTEYFSALNRIENPLFVEQGTELEILV